MSWSVLKYLSTYCFKFRGSVERCDVHVLLRERKMVNVKVVLKRDCALEVCESHRQLTFAFRRLEKVNTLFTLMVN